MDIDALRDEFVDEHGYPTDEALEKLRVWDGYDVNGALDFMAALWLGHDYGWAARTLSIAEQQILNTEKGERFIRFVTAGWSGNESLISAFNEKFDNNNCINLNGCLRGRAWRLSARGGLHIYQYD